MEFQDDQFENNAELLLGMKEINQRRKELNMKEDEWVAVWMLSIIKKRKKIDIFIYQALRDVVKLGGDNVIKNFKEKFKELQVEGCRKDAVSTSVMYNEDMEMDVDLPGDHYAESEMKEMETMYMGTESEARNRFERNGPCRRQSFQRQRSNSRDSRYGGFQK